jgi:hypothetical protein
MTSFRCEMKRPAIVPAPLSLASVLTFFRIET